MRKEQKLVIGFVGTVVGIVGVLHVYLPFYSELGNQARARAGARAASGESEATSKRSASMWKNMEQRKKTQPKEDES